MRPKKRSQATLEGEAVESLGCATSLCKNQYKSHKKPTTNNPTKPLINGYMFTTPSIKKHEDVGFYVEPESYYFKPINT